MKNKLTRKLMLSAFTLLFAVISLGASTYAWFILSEEASVKSFSGTVTAGSSGLEIQVTAIDADPVATKWRSTELDLLQDFAAATQVTFDAVQNNNGEAKFNPDAFTFNTKNEDGEFIEAQLNQDYIGFRLYFRLSDTTGIGEGSKNVSLTSYNLSTEASTVNEWYVNKQYKNANGVDVVVGQDDVIYYVSDAARIAFVSATVREVYESHTLLGADGFKSNHIGSNGAFDYYNEVSENDITLPSEYYRPQTSLNGSYSFGTLSASSNLTYVDVYIWIDGWDQECINAIFKQQLNIVLEFALTNHVCVECSEEDCDLCIDPNHYGETQKCPGHEE